MNIMNTANFNNSVGIPLKVDEVIKNETSENLETYKNKKKILFIDDDNKFKVVQILKTSG